MPNNAPLAHIADMNLVMEPAMRPYVHTNTNPNTKPNTNLVITTRNTALLRGRLIAVSRAKRRGKSMHEMVLDLSPEGAQRQRTVRLTVHLDVRSVVVPRAGDVVAVAARRSRRPWGAADLRVVSFRACETPFPCAASA